MVAVSRAVLGLYRAVTCYNSPYPAHAEGCAVDLYPDAAREVAAPSPVAGTVADVRTVRAPSRPYAVRDDHLIVIETDEHLARILHVDPTVAPGNAVRIGDVLGTTVRSGFFAPWVDDHLHLGFRPIDADPYRATGSLPVELACDPVPVSWDGTGTVIEVAETYVVLDAPGHPAPGDRFAGIAAAGGVLDGGLPHYEGGGLLGGADGRVELAGAQVGTATDRTVTWDDVTVRVNGTPVTGISLALQRDRLGVKLVSWDGLPVAVGDSVEVTIG